MQVIQGEKNPNNARGTFQTILRDIILTWSLSFHFLKIKSCFLTHIIYTSLLLKTLFLSHITLS